MLIPIGKKTWDVKFNAQSHGLVEAIFEDGVINDIIEKPHRKSYHLAVLIMASLGRVKANRLNSDKKIYGLLDEDAALGRDRGLLRVKFAVAYAASQPGSEGAKEVERLREHFGDDYEEILSEDFLQSSTRPMKERAALPSVQVSEK